MKMNYPLMIPFPAQNCQVYRIFTFILRVVAQLKRIFTVIALYLRYSQWLMWQGELNSQPDFPR